MKIWISFFFRYILIGIIGIAAIIYFIPTDQENHIDIVKLSRDKLNIKQMNFDQLSAMFKSFTTEDEQENEQEDEQPLILEKNQLHSQAPEKSSNYIKTVDKTVPAHINADDGERWGIVSAPKASYYTIKGKFIGHLAPGTALNIIKITQTAKGPIAVCRPFKQPSATPVLTKIENLTIRNNNINNISKELEKLYVQQAKLKVEAITIKKQKEKELRRDNPHAIKYATVKKEYHDYWRKVKDLTQKRDNSTGSKQMEYADELRSMKGHDIIIANNLKQVKSDYNNWNIAHPRPATSNVEVNNLLTELNRIGKIISNMEKSSS
jgi:hypothetical protein